VNLYSISTNQEAIIRLFRVVNRYVGNLPPMPGVFSDYPAPVVRNAGADRELMRWGMPPPPKFGGPPVTNIRNTASPHWRGWLARGLHPTVLPLDMSNCRACDIIANVAAENLSCGMMVKFRKIA
jgi:putative SOS response-associated peptidase YedK